MQLSKILSWIAFGSLILTGIVISIKQLREPDIWWMLKTGEFIVENGYVMKEDIFSYSFPGTSWINVKWGFEVIIYALSKIGGPEFTMILQAIATTLILIFLGKSTKVLRSDLESVKSNPYLNPLFIFLGFFLLFSIEYRINGRPEMTSHLMTVIYSWLFLKYRKQPGNFIFLLIPLQIIWVNMHEAFGTGFVLIAGFTTGYWLEWILKKTLLLQQKKFDLLKITTAGVVAVPAVAIHPHGFSMITHPFEIFGQVLKNRFTSESFDYTHPNYWEKEPYIAIAVFIISLIFLALKYRESTKGIIRRFLTNLGIGYIILFCLFFYLGFTAYRNIPFFILFSFPLLIIGFNQITNQVASESLKKKLTNPIMGLIIMIGIIFYTAIVTNKYYELFNEREKYGLKVNPDYHPIGAANFAKENNLKGTFFADYLTSSYLLWDLHPEFETFIDLRDMDVFKYEFFLEYLRMVNEPRYFEAQDGQHHFDHIILYKPIFNHLHNFLHTSDIWKTVYADPIAAVYVRDTPENSAVIKKYGVTTDKEFFTLPEKLPTSSLSKGISNLFWPGYNLNDPSKINYDLEAARHYLTLKMFGLATQYAQSALNSKKGEKWEALLLLGDIYNQQGDDAKDPKWKNDWYDNAAKLYRETLDENPKATTAMLALGLMELQENRIPQAKGWFRLCLEVDDKLTGCYLGLAQIQDKLSQQVSNPGTEYLEQWIIEVEKALATDPNNMQIKLVLGNAYCTLGKCKKAIPLLEESLKFKMLNYVDRQNGENCLSQCRIRNK